MNDQPKTLKTESTFTKFNIETDCMVGDIFESYDTPNGSIVYGTRLDELDLINNKHNSRYGFIILLENDNFVFRDIIEITPTKIVTRDRKEAQHQILNREQIKSCYKIEEREYY